MAGVCKFVNASDDVVYGTIIFGNGRANFTLQSRGSEYETQVEPNTPFCWSKEGICNDCDGHLRAQPGTTMAIGHYADNGCL